MIHQKQMPHTFISSSIIYIHTYIHRNNTTMPLAHSRARKNV